MWTEKRRLLSHDDHDVHRAEARTSSFDVEKCWCNASTGDPIPQVIPITGLTLSGLKAGDAYHPPARFPRKPRPKRSQPGRPKVSGCLKLVIRHTCLRLVLTTRYILRLLRLQTTTANVSDFQRAITYG